MTIYPQRGDRPVPKAEQDRVMFKVWCAYWAISRGEALRRHVRDLLDAINIVRALCELGKVPACVLDDISRANDAIHRMPMDQEGTYCMDGEALASMAEVCTRYDVAVFKLSASTLERAKHKFLGDLVAQAIRPEVEMTA